MCLGKVSVINFWHLMWLKAWRFIAEIELPLACMQGASFHNAGMCTQTWEYRSCCWLAAWLLAGHMPSFALADEAVPAQHSAQITIGVQIIEDRVDEVQQWQRWVNTWSSFVPHVQVQLQPLRWDALQAQVESGQLQFAVTSPGHYVALEARHGAVRLASQWPVNSRDGSHAVGSAVVVRADSAWQHLEELKAHTVAAVAQDAFGGYQVMAAQWRSVGLHPATDLQMRFTGYPMAQTLHALRDGQAHAAILRVCMLEQMVARGEIAQGSYRVLPPVQQALHAPPAAGCQASSPLYPGWALAALPHTPPEISHAVLLAVLSHGSADGSRWTVPADYQAVHEVLRSLQVAPYAPEAPSLRVWLWQHRYWGAGLLFSAAFTLAYLVHVEALVKRRTAALTRSLQERDALAQQMAHAHEKIEHMGRLSVLGELSATLAHEISHPLASLSNYVGGLRRRHAAATLQPAQLTDALEAMDEAVSRTQRVLESVRALARKRVSVQRQAALWPLVQETVVLFESISGASGQSLRIQLACPPALQQAQVLMDALQIQQVLLNLLKNAQDLHRAQGRLHMPVVVNLSPGPDTETLVLAVCDQGPSLSSEALAQLFEPFFTTKPDGLGLGLSISRNIAELHGGHLQAHAQGSAGGLCMELLLPLAQPNGALKI